MIIKDQETPDWVRDGVFCRWRLQIFGFVLFSLSQLTPKTETFHTPQKHEEHLKFTTPAETHLLLLCLPFPAYKVSHHPEDELSANCAIE